MTLLPSNYSFRLAPKRGGGFSFSPEHSGVEVHEAPAVTGENVSADTDHNRRLFLRALGVMGLGAMGATLLPARADALVMGGAPATSVVGLKNSSNVRIDPATQSGQGILKKTVALTGSGAVYTPTSGKSVRIYNTRFSLSADMTSVSFRFTSGGTDYEVYLSPKAGGLYGANNQPNYVQGGVNQAFYCVVSGTGTVQINFDYLEV